MKKVLLLAMIGALCLTATACADGDGGYSSVPTTAPPATQQAPSSAATQPSAKETDPPAKKETEPPTEKPTENTQAAANQAYLTYLQGHSDWFHNLGNDYTSSVQEHHVAFYDINNDGLQEMLLVHPVEGTQSLQIALNILTYADGGLVTMYDDYYINIPGAGPTYQIFMNSEGKLCSLASNFPHSYVSRFDIDGTSVSKVGLAESSTPVGADELYLIGGENATEEEYRAYWNSFEKKIKVCLLSDPNKHHDISMSYEAACKHLQE